jgi:hypothetical protein
VTPVHSLNIHSFWALYIIFIIVIIMSIELCTDWRVVEGKWLVFSVIITKDYIIMIVLKLLLESTVLRMPPGVHSTQMAIPCLHCNRYIHCYSRQTLSVNTRLSETTWNGPHFVPRSLPKFDTRLKISEVSPVYIIREGGVMRKPTVTHLVLSIEPD